MIETVRFSIDGSHDELEALLARAALKGKVIDYPAGSVVYVNVVVGTPEFTRLESCIPTFDVEVRRYSILEGSADELATSELFSNVGCRWIEDDERQVDPPKYSGTDFCPECGKGSRDHKIPLRGKLGGFRKYHLVRKPPALVLVSLKLASIIESNGWSGVELRPVIDRKTDQPSDLFKEAWITSILPRMDASAGIERFRPSPFCEKCRRIGYQLSGRQPVYASSVLEVAADWNLSTEWLAPHFVPCPKLICSRRVVHELLKLEPKQNWIPVKLVPSESRGEVTTPVSTQPGSSLEAAGQRAAIDNPTGGEPVDPKPKSKTKSKDRKDLAERLRRAGIVSPPFSRRNGTLRTSALGQPRGSEGMQQDDEGDRWVRELPPPDGAGGDEASEIIRAWVIAGQLGVSMRAEVVPHAVQWGGVLASLARYVTLILEDRSDKESRQRILDDVIRGFEQSLLHPEMTHIEADPPKSGDA